MIVPINTINGFTITEKAKTSKALSHKLSQYRQAIERLSDPDWYDMKEQITKDKDKYERMLITGKALIKS